MVNVLGGDAPGGGLGERPEERLDFVHARPVVLVIRGDGGGAEFGGKNVASVFPDSLVFLAVLPRSRKYQSLIHPIGTWPKLHFDFCGFIPRCGRPLFGFQFFFIHLFRRMQLLLGGLERLTFAIDGPEETGIITLMTRRAVLLDLDQQGVAVAIKRDIFHGLGVAALLALHPVFLA